MAFWRTTTRPSPSILAARNNGRTLFWRKDTHSAAYKFGPKSESRRNNCGECRDRPKLSWLKCTQQLRDRELTRIYPFRSPLLISWTELLLPTCKNPIEYLGMKGGFIELNGLNIPVEPFFQQAVGSQSVFDEHKQRNAPAIGHRGFRI